LPRPGILLSPARAYHNHVAEMKGGQSGEPIGFLKNANAIIGHRTPILAPAAAPDQLDFEAEIPVVFGRACHGVPAAEAMQ
jgi:2-keto-4-pentenoate hydratase/2-oxohepta-3-ene-1,7-dioic acid hydratase in catechol pathway